jgi:hypothetical protein
MDKYDYEYLEETMSDPTSEIKDGGAALTAYALMQFTQMSDAEREKIKERDRTINVTIRFIRRSIKNNGSGDD